jgi:hypothetical protein
MVEDSHSRASRTETDRRKSNRDFNGDGTVKALSVARSRQSRIIPLCQTDPDHHDDNDRVVTAFEFFGAVDGLQ